MASLLRFILSALQNVSTAVFHLITAGYFRQIHEPSPSSHAMKNIVILGASYAGLSVAHQLLKQRGTIGPIKVTLVTPNTHLYWNIAAPRGLIPGQIADEQLFQPIAPGFEQYPSERFEFILASAEDLDVEAKKVFVFNPAAGKKTLDFDILVLATGTSLKEVVPLKSLGSTEATKVALHQLQSRVKNAKKIVVAGGGVTGCEVAGELGCEYGDQKEIVLVSLISLAILLHSLEESGI